MCGAFPLLKFPPNVVKHCLQLVCPLLGVRLRHSDIDAFPSSGRCMQPSSAYARRIAAITDRVGTWICFISSFFSALSFLALSMCFALSFSQCFCDSVDSRINLRTDRASLSSQSRAEIECR